MKKRNMGTVAVPGGAGYIGSVLCRQLLDVGYRVRVLDRCFFGEQALDGCRSAGGDRFELRIIDIRDVKPDDLSGCMAVIDLSGLSNDPSCELDPQLTESINLSGGLALLEAAKKAGVRRYIYQSSCSVYGSAAGTLLTEHSPLAPLSAYAQSKVTMEKHCKEAQGGDFSVAITRMATVFGASPRMRFDLIINIMTLLADRDGRVFVLGGGAQWRPLIHVRDAARAFRLLLEAPDNQFVGHTYNVGDTRQNYRVSRIARMVAQTVGDTDIITVPEDADKRSYRVDCSKFRETFGFETKLDPKDGVREVLTALHDESIDTGIRTKTVNYYRYLLDAKEILDRVMLDGRLL
ncbi:MAG: SDR family oxidoreductase [Proteobacteria bacterium]|nr:SDR family oxidoreductase [Pseudomonadota bacterium]